MGRKHFFERAGRQSVPGHVNDVVGATHDPQVTIFIFVAGVGGLVVTGISSEV
jgi:hypothetical protein